MYTYETHVFKYEHIRVLADQASALIGLYAHDGWKLHTFTCTDGVDGPTIIVVVEKENEHGV